LAENPIEAMYCLRCGNGLYGQIPPKSKSDSKIILIIAIVVIAVVVVPIVMSAILYVMVLGVGPGPQNTATLSTVRGSTALNYTWTITAISGGASVLRSDVYVQLKNSSSFIIYTESLNSASGTHGFGYMSASYGSYMSIGDVFTLSKNYGPGSSITLVTSSGSWQYAAMTT